MTSISRQTAKREKEEPREGSSLGLVLAAIALFGLSALMLYALLATSAQGTAMDGVKAALRGLGGGIAFLVPALTAWAGALCVMAIRDSFPGWWRAALHYLMLLCAFTAVHLFSAQRIRMEYMSISGYTNFVVQSYRAGIGGGALGAVLAWPLYRYLGGAWGGLIADLLILCLALTATGRMGKMVRWSRDRLNERREDESERRRERAVENLFEPASDELDGAFAGNRRQSRRDARPEARRAMHIDDHLSPGLLSAAGAAPQDRTIDNPVAQPGRKGRTVNLDAPPARKPAAEKKSAPVRPVKGGKLYREAEGQAPGEVSPADALLAENPASGVRIGRRGGWKPDSPSAPAPVKDADGAFTVDETAYPAATRHGDAPEADDQFRIEPDKYELDDEPAPAPVKPAQKPLGKLKRPDPAEYVEEEPYNYPPIDLLNPGDAGQAQHNRQADMEKAELLGQTLSSFGIATTLTGIAHGPVVTRFELQPAPGVKVSRITSLADDIALNLAAESVRIEAPIPGKPAVGVEIPNDERETVSLRDVLESPEARKHPSKIAIGLGKDNSGRFIVADIAKMPHVLIAGQTGSGKSVCINSLIISILYRATPDEVKLILIDPKVVELSVYNGIPHLIAPVVTDAKKAASALDWAVAEMGQRYKRFAEHGVRDIKGYNKKLPASEKPMPQMVIVIDELADLMMVAPGDVEDSICRLAQLARAAGMHLVIATQRPSVNVITGIIKANIPTRIAFAVASQVDSRTMIDHGGAEKLLGRGDMLFVPSGMKPIRVQGVWVSDEEVETVVGYIKERSEAVYDEDMVEHMNNAVLSDAEKEDADNEYDPRLPEAVEIVVEAGQASISMLQRRMRVGYARAGRLIDEMSLRGIVSEADGAKPRTVLITREQYKAMFDEDAGTSLLP